MDAAEPWQGDWEKNVRVECAGGAGESEPVRGFVFHLFLVSC